MRYFIGFLITIGLIIILIVLLLSGHKGKQAQPQVSEKPKTVSQLAAYADTDVMAQLIIDGAINADQTHAALRITVGQNDVTYEQIQGYQGVVVNKQVYANNSNAYSNFLYAIGRSGFLLGDINPRLANEKGFCSVGERYVFELKEGDHDIQRYWATSCGGGVPKTYKGNLSATLQLFQLQVPDYQTLIQNVQLQ